jgi:hypothetical protein
VVLGTFFSADGFGKTAVKAGGVKFLRAESDEGG